VLPCSEKPYILSAVNSGIIKFLVDVLTILYCQIKSENMGDTMFSQKQPEYNVYIRYNLNKYVPYFDFIMMSAITLNQQNNMGDTMFSQKQSEYNQCIY